VLKKGLKLLGYLVGALVAIVAVAAIYFSARLPRTFPDVPTPAISASTDPAVIARGEYLFHAVAHCTACHDPDIRTVAPGDKGVPKGGYEWKMGPLGTIRSANITMDEATGVGKWSDGDLARVIKHGVRPDHRAAIMMFGVGPMADEDITALVSYVRTIEPVSNAVAPHEIGVMGKVLFSTAMKFFASPKMEMAPPPFVPEGGASVERGKYLAEGPAMCFGCHSEFDGEGFVGQMFCGNPQSWPDPDHPEYEVFAPNLTPHPEHGAIAKLSEDEFLARIRAPRMYKASPMAWENVREMTDDDLRSIFRYLMSMPACEGNYSPTYRKKE
jgi:mono/diheme cytochrome c family protein